MNKTKAIKFLKAAGVEMSVRTLQRHVQRGDLAVAYVRGRKGDEADFEETSLRAFADRLKQKTYVSRANGDGAAVTSDAPAGALVRANDLRSGALAELLAVIEAKRAQQSQPPVTISDLAHKLTLNLDEAAQLSGLSRGHLREAIGAGKLKAKIIGRGWRVKRADLDRYVTKL